MRFALILAEKAFYPIAVLCRVLDVSRSGFHTWARRGPSDRKREDGRLEVHVVTIHRESRGTYGSTRITGKLRANGQPVGRKRVARLMTSAGIEARPRRRFKKTTYSKHGEAIAPNLLGQVFDAERPNQVWVTDVKAVWTTDGWLYVAPVIDLCSRRVVGLGIRENNDTDLALAALDDAVAQRNPTPGLIHHSDRGAPYASHRCRRRLERIRSLASMSRKGDCWDNTEAEGFFSTLVHELLDRLPRGRWPRTRGPSASTSTDSAIHAVGIRPSDIAARSSKSFVFSLPRSRPTSTVYGIGASPGGPIDGE